MNLPLRSGPAPPTGLGKSASGRAALRTSESWKRPSRFPKTRALNLGSSLEANAHKRGVPDFPQVANARSTLWDAAGSAICLGLAASIFENAGCLE
jgi:hypothetical protein